MPVPDPSSGEGSDATAAVAGAWTITGAAGVAGAVTACATTGMLVAAGAPGGVNTAGIVIAAGRRTRADCCGEVNAGTERAAEAGPTFRCGFGWDRCPDGPESRPVPVGATGAARPTALFPRLRGDAGDGSA